MCIYRGKLFYYLDFLLNERSDFEVDDIDNIMDAKDYLCDRFEDITRSSLKTKKSIFEAAEAHNIIFTKLQ